MSASQDFLTELRREIEHHAAVTHGFLSRLSEGAFERRDYQVFVEHHYPLVCAFTSYMEVLLMRAPDSGARLWLARVLVDEYGGGSDGHDHPALYETFVQATGGADFSTLRQPAVEFVETHQRIMRERPFLEGLGAVGPGHEWSIPAMFSAILPGLQRAGFAAEEIDYFTLHLQQDCDHGAWLEEALRTYCDRPEVQAHVRRGALASLEARRRFWDGLERAWERRQTGSTEREADSGLSLVSLLARCRRLSSV